MNIFNNVKSQGFTLFYRVSHYLSHNEEAPRGTLQVKITKNNVTKFSIMINLQNHCLTGEAPGEGPGDPPIVCGFTLLKIIPPYGLAIRSLASNVSQRLDFMVAAADGGANFGSAVCHSG